MNTALALLVLHQEGPSSPRLPVAVYDAALEASVDDLRSQQDPSGHIGTGDLRDHAICTLVLAELGERRYGGRFADAVAAAVRHLQATAPRWTSSLAVAPWAVLALRETGSLGDLRVELDDAPPGVRAWLRIALGADPRRDDDVKLAMAEILSGLDAHDPAHAGVLTWLFGSMAAFEYGGSAWKSASAFLREQVARAQRQDGSWDPVGADERVWLGRVGVTALTVLAYDTHRAGASSLGLR